MQELFYSLGIEWPVLIAQVVNFAVLLFILQRFAYRPVLHLLDERRKRAAEALEREEKAAAKLADAEADREKILVAARAESQKILDEAKKGGELLKQKRLAEAAEEIANMRSEAERKLLGDKVRLVSEAKKEIGGLVVGAIEKAFGDVLDSRTQGRMVEQALAAIREGEKNSTGF